MIPLKIEKSIIKAIFWQLRHNLGIEKWWFREKSDGAFRDEKWWFQEVEVYASCSAQC